MQTISSNRSFFRDNIVELAIIILSIVDVFLKVVPVLPFSIATILLLVVRSNKVENVFMCFLVYSSFLGFVMNYQGVSGIGGYAYIIGAILFLFYCATRKIEVFEYKKGLIWLLALFCLFICSAITTNGGNYALIKIQKTTIQGCVYLFAFVLLFSNTKKIRYTHVGLCFIVYAAVLLKSSITINNIPGASSLLDIGFLHVQTYMDFEKENGRYLVSYQDIGNAVLQGFGLIMFEKNKHNLKSLLFVITVASIIILYAGSRQAIFIIAALIILWLLFDNKNIGRTSQILVVSLVIVSFGVLWGIMTMQDSILSSIAEDGFIAGGSREANLTYGWIQFVNNPAMGVGFGRYVGDGVYGGYAHNLFIEILSEMGIIGLLFILFLYIPVIMFYKSIFLVYGYLFLAIVGRSMASGGLDSNIIIFSLLSSVPSLYYSLKVKN